MLAQCVNGHKEPNLARLADPSTVEYSEGSVNEVHEQGVCKLSDKQKDMKLDFLVQVCLLWE